MSRDLGETHISMILWQLRTVNKTHLRNIYADKRNASELDTVRNVDMFSIFV